MRIVSFRSPPGVPRVGVVIGGDIVDVRAMYRRQLRTTGHSDTHAEQLSALTVPSAMADVFGLRLQDNEEIVAGINEASNASGSARALLEDAGVLVPLDSVRLLPPISPGSNFICIGQNYGNHLRETGRGIPQRPSLFLRTLGSVVGHREALVRPKVSAELDWEGELAVVIGRPGRHIEPGEYRHYVAGYTIFNDGSVRDYQKNAPTPTAGKNFARSGSLGPWVLTDDELDDPDKVTIVTRIDDEVMQSASTADMVVNVGNLIAYISSFIELQPGDVIATGTPSGVGYWRDPPRFLLPGETLSVELSGIGELVNTVIDETP